MEAEAAAAPPPPPPAPTPTEAFLKDIRDDIRHAARGGGQSSSIFQREH
jgi:hypothetical protein